MILIMEEEKEIIVLQSQSDFIVLSASEIDRPQLERAENVKDKKVLKKNFVCPYCLTT